MVRTAANVPFTPPNHDQVIATLPRHSGRCPDAWWSLLHTDRLNPTLWWVKCPDLWNRNKIKTLTIKTAEIATIRLCLWKNIVKHIWLHLRGTKPKKTVNSHHKHWRALTCEGTNSRQLLPLINQTIKVSWIYCPFKNLLRGVPQLKRNLLKDK